jgi:hypothetical protein
MMNGKAVLQLSEQKDRCNHSKVIGEDQTLSVLMLQEITGINRETISKILVEDLQ